MTRAFLLTAVVTALAIACGSETTSPEEALPVRLESAHGIYLMASGDSVDVEAQEAYYVWLLDRVDIALPEPLRYFKYRNRRHLREVTGEDTNGFAEIGNFRFHSIWPMDNHESVHALVSSALNLAPAFFNEGIAVAHQTLPHLDVLEPVWNGEPLDVIARRANTEGTLPPLDALLENRDFFEHGTDFIYPIAGSFVHYLIRLHGYAPLKQLFLDSSFGQSRGELRTAFQRAYGIELDLAWSNWLEFLDG